MKIVTKIALVLGLAYLTNKVKNSNTIPRIEELRSKIKNGTATQADKNELARLNAQAVKDRLIAANS